MRKYLSLLLCVCLCLSFSGCYDSKEVSDELYAILIGMDRGTQGGVRLSVIVPIYGENTDSEQGQNKLYMAEAETVSEALNVCNRMVARKISLLHLKAVVFSADLAKSGLQPHMTALLSHIEIRNAMSVLVADQTAEQVLKQCGKNSVGALSKEMEMLLLENRYNVFFPKVVLENFADRIASSYRQASCLYQSSENGNVIGLALFQEDRMVGFLTEQEASYAMMANGSFAGGNIPLPSSDGTLFTVILKPDGKPRIRCTQTYPPSLEISVPLRLSLLEGEIEPDLLLHFEQILQERMTQTLQKTQTLGSDICDLGDAMTSYFPTIPQWEQFDWTKKYPSASVAVRVHLR